MTFFRLRFLAIAIVFFNDYLFSQTAGIGEVNAVESKAQLIEKNKNTIAQYTAELGPLQDSLNNKIQRLKDELAALIKERDNIIADMKVGAKCSQCGKYKSQFEKEGKSFEQHL